MACSGGSVFHNVEEGDKLMAASAEFAVAMYNKIAASSTGNVFFSPISISMALAMTYLGARGETKAQMKSGLFLDKVNEDELHKCFSDLRVALKSENEGITLQVANRLFGQKSYKFLAEYLNATRDLYGAELRPLDFIDDRNAAVAEINGWVEDQTNHKIKDIIPIDAVDERTRLILVNAIYFKGDWIKKFDHTETKSEDFHVSADEKVKVPLMRLRKGKFSYGVDQKLNCQAIELPYSGKRLSMFILLPDHSVTALVDVEHQLTYDNLINVHQHFQMRVQEVNVWFPRFKLEQSMDLNSVLMQLGVIDMFTERKADFSGMDGTWDLYVSKVLHKSFVEVNEEGSEAAAATAVVVRQKMCAAFRESFDFRADHPFLFFIMDNSTKAILFLGKFIKP